MNVEHYKILFDYNYWAMHQMWACVVELTEEQFTQAVPYSHGSVHHQVVHTVGAEWVWIERLNKRSPEGFPTVEELPTRDVIRLKWDETETAVRAYLDNLRDSQLDRIISYTRTVGEVERNARWEILSHMINHGTDHRAQIMATIAQVGGRTIEHDLLFYFRDKPEHRRRLAMARFDKHGIT